MCARYRLKLSLRHVAELLGLTVTELFEEFSERPRLNISIAQRVPAPGALMAVWAAGGLLALCGALTLAEITTALPRTGGIYVIVREGWGRLPAVRSRRSTAWVSAWPQEC